MPKIAVYAITLNEEKLLKRWHDSAKDADLLLIADTGSTDRTVALAKALGVKVFNIEVKPWRFDVARNASLALIPDEIDICVQLDIDEVLPAGWRKKVETAWQSGNVWPQYKHVTSRNPDGSPRDYQLYFKIHPRKGFIWRYPIHEVLVPVSGEPYSRHEIDLEVDHLKDHTKSRSNYLPLLEMAVKEMPQDWRMNHYLTREYYYYRDWQKVINSAYKSLQIKSGWDVERAATCIWSSESAFNLGYPYWAKEWADRATIEAPHFYEAWWQKADIHHRLAEWEQCYESASKIRELSRQHHHLVRSDIWAWRGYDLLALSAHFTKRDSEAVKYGTLAAEANPNDPRIIKNLEVFRESLARNSNPIH